MENASGRSACAKEDFFAGKLERTIACGESAFSGQSLWHGLVWQRTPVLTVGCSQQQKFAVHRITQREAALFREARDGVEKKFLAFIPILQNPRFAAVSSFVDARFLGLAAGHQVGGAGAECHDSAKIESVSPGDLQLLPGPAFVHG